MRVEAFGISVDNITLSDAVSVTLQWAHEQHQRIVVTPNPEMVVAARRDPVFAEILRSADLALPDGIGLTAALRMVGAPVPERVTGTDFVVELLRAAPPDTSFFFLGGVDGATEIAAARARSELRATVVGTASPSWSLYRDEGLLTVVDPEGHRYLMNDITAASPKILFVALGHGKQEKWIAQFLSQCPSVRVAIGIGGAIDYLSGKVSRAPRPLRYFGLEWLWRLGMHPRRLPRILTAVVVFPWIVLRWVLATRLLYRPNVVACVLNGRGEILLVERRDEPGHWQFPQGGQEAGESAETAVLRELREEVGSSAFKVLGQSRSTHRYSWPRRGWRPGRTTSAAPGGARLRYGYRGQRQTVMYVKFIGAEDALHLDQREHTHWRWVRPEQLLEAVNPVRRSVARIILRELNHYVS